MTTIHADIEGISRHIERHIGPIATVYHEIVSDELHIDIHHVRSSLFRRYEVLVTSGMSALPMALPPDVQQPRYAEIVTILPKGWPISKEAFLDERNYWPVRLMKVLARLPKDSRTWLGFGHTVANTDDGITPNPYAPDTALCAAAVLPSSTLGENAWSMDRADGETVAFFAAVPLYKEELAFKMEHGIDPLLDLFDKHGVTDRIDPNRRCVVTADGA